jgi:murein DD-endopeptidase MepM/ murein hydrolase activator NlpD
MPSPIKGKLPSTPYKKLGRRWSKGYHTGLDYAVPTGTDVHAIADGTNRQCKLGSQLWCAVSVCYQWRLDYLCPPISHTCKAWQKIKAGQVIAKSGNTGNSTGPHLHVELRNHIRWSLGSDMDLSPLIGIKPAKRVTKAKAKVVAPVIKKKRKP